jgi:hypothetical protein
MTVLNRPTEPAASTASEQAAPAATTDQTTVTRRRIRPRPGFRVAGAGADAARFLARVITLAAGIVALIIALGIAFIVLKAAPGNTIVSDIHSWAKWLVSPFDGMFHLHSARGPIALNWGIALVVYLVLGSLLTRLVMTPAWALRRRRAALTA